MTLWSVLLLQVASVPTEAVAWSVVEDNGLCMATPSGSSVGSRVLANTPWSKKVSVVIRPSAPTASVPKVQMTLLPFGRAVDASARANRRADGSSVVIVDTFVTNDWAEAQGLAVAFGKRERVEVADLPQAMARLTECGDVVLKRYGVERAQRRPSKDLGDVMRARVGELFGASAYPPAALKLGQKGAVTVLLNVAADGSITKCQAVMTSGGQALDDGTCRIFMTKLKLPSADNGRYGWDAVKVTWIHSSLR